MTTATPRLGVHLRPVAALIAPIALLSAACAVDTTPPDEHLAAGAPEPTVAEDFVARNGAFDEVHHLLARQYFNDRTEVLSFYEPTPGSFLLSAAGRPKDGHTAIALSHKNPRLADVWRLVAAPGQAAPASLEALLSEPRSAAVATESVAPHTLPMAATDASRAPAAGGPRILTVDSNYCSNGSFISDFGETDGIGGTGAFWNPPHPPVFESLDYELQGPSSQSGFEDVFKGVASTGMAVCPSNDTGTFNGASVSPGGYDAMWTWSSWNCGFNLACCAFTTSCDQCNIPGTSADWNWSAGCPSNAGSCTDDDLTYFVVYKTGVGAGLAVCEN